MKNPREMMIPVRCSYCGEIYDLCGVKEITARYLDCTCYKTPCCSRNVDDREGWVGSPAFRRIDKDALPEGYGFAEYGEEIW